MMEGEFEDGIFPEHAFCRICNRAVFRDDVNAKGNCVTCDPPPAAKSEPVGHEPVQATEGETD